MCPRHRCWHWVTGGYYRSFHTGHYLIVYLYLRIRYGIEIRSCIH